MRLPIALRALEHRDFRLFWSGQLVSVIGTWMQSVAQAWLVLELTDSPFRLGLITTLQFAPMLLLTVVAGAIADRLPKRRLVLASQVVLAAQAVSLATLVATGHVRYWQVAALAAVYGLANAVDLPARQSFIVEMVGKTDLTNAIALNSAMFNGARVIGPALAGFLIARWGMALAFFVNAASFLAVIGALSLLRVEGLPRGPRGRSIPAEIAEGLAYAARTPRVALVLSLLLVVSVFLLNYNVLVPLVARQVLRQEAGGFGLLMATLGAGAVTGAATMATVARSRPPLSGLVVPALVLGVATVTLAFVRHVALAAPLLFVMGFSGILFMAGANTTLQLTVPDALRGRMMSLYGTVFAGVSPIGAFSLGSVIEAFGVPTGCLAAGGLGVASVMAVLVWWTRRDRRSGFVA
jgi:MFS family permease